MRHAVTLLAALMFAGCAGNDSARSPDVPIITAPQSPAASSVTWIWGMVVNSGGTCITDATIRVVRGQRAGATLGQALPCVAWDDGGGFSLNDLTPGVAMTIEASAPGYLVKEITIVPLSGPQGGVLIKLSRI